MTKSVTPGSRSAANVVVLSEREGFAPLDARSARFRIFGRLLVHRSVDADDPNRDASLRKEHFDMLLAAGASPDEAAAVEQALWEAAWIGSRELRSLANRADWGESFAATWAADWDAMIWSSWHHPRPEPADVREIR